MKPAKIKVTLIGGPSAGLVVDAYSDQRVVHVFDPLRMPRTEPGEPTPQRMTLTSTVYEITSLSDGHLIYYVGTCDTSSPIAMLVNDYIETAAVNALRNEVAALKKQRKDMWAFKKQRDDMLAFMRTAQVSSGVCCCGSSVDSHSMGDGHSPMDMWDNAVGEWVEKIAKYDKENGL
jgi:hypothetical protein